MYYKLFDENWKIIRRKFMYKVCQVIYSATMNIFLKAELH